MLKEYKTVSQEKTGWRRLFSDENFDLYVWYDQPAGQIVGLQLVELHGAESHKALTWERGKKSYYAGVATEGPYNPSPILVINGAFQHDQIFQRFCAADAGLPSDIRQLARQMIENHHD